mmetsp:Transcript_43575/g.106552  ORF Transcript_43575/g.106552 Transcript_43575/m.106552 type:complete len:183 (+) Transcript_43575:157-705(+)
MHGPALPGLVLLLTLALALGFVRPQEQCGAPRSAAAMSADDARRGMLSEISQGGMAHAAVPGEDRSDKAILTRGCDPAMAARAGTMLPPMLGNAQVVACTGDDEFFRLLGERRWDAVFFAPGACRFSAARQPIPGSIPKTKGWSLEEYKAAVRERLGDDVPIVETTNEREIVPRLRAALGLS